MSPRRPARYGPPAVTLKRPAVLHLRNRPPLACSQPPAGWPQHLRRACLRGCAHVLNLSSRNISYPQQPLGTHLCGITVVRRRPGGGSSSSSSTCGARTDCGRAVISRRQQHPKLRCWQRHRQRCLLRLVRQRGLCQTRHAQPRPPTPCLHSRNLLRGKPPRRRLAAPLRNRGAPALLCPQLRRCSGTPMVCLTRPP